MEGVQTEEEDFVLGDEGRGFFVDAKCIGRGTYGQVFSATCKESGTPVVIKRVRIETYFNMRGFKREVDIQTQMGELGVAPRVFSWWVHTIYTKGQWRKRKGRTRRTRRKYDFFSYGIMVMQPMKGSLDDLIHEMMLLPPLACSEAMSLIWHKDVVPLIDYINGMGIVHMDCYAKNVMYTEDELGKKTFYLIDWGFAARFLPCGRVIDNTVGAARSHEMFDPGYDRSLLHWSMAQLVGAEHIKLPVDLIDRNVFIPSLHEYASRDQWPAFSYQHPVYLNHYKEHVERYLTERGRRATSAAIALITGSELRLAIEDPFASKEPVPVQLSPPEEIKPTKSSKGKGKKKGRGKSKLSNVQEVDEALYPEVSVRS